MLLLALLAASALSAQDVEVRADIVYASTGGRELHLDLFLPKQGAGPFPAIVYIHGGGWQGGTRKQFHPQAEHMARRGFIGACIEYRLSREAKYPAAVDDAKGALRFLRKNAAEYRIHPDRIGIAGGSAGGHLAALVGVTADESTRVRAVAAFNPVLDLIAAGKAGLTAGPVVQFLGATFDQAPALWREASPSTHVSAKAPPFLFLHGTDDTTVPYAQSVDMRDALVKAGVRAELFTAKGAGHGFFNRPPWFEPALKKMEEFFVSTLGKEAP